MSEPQTALTRAPHDSPLHRLEYIQRLGTMLSASQYFTDAKDMAQAAVKVMAGEELGIPPLAAMMGIHVIKGKVALGANLIGSRVRAHGYDFRILILDRDNCVIEFLGKADATGKRKSLGQSAFTRQDANDAGITSDMYKKFPRNMLFSRAMSNGAKWYCPEILCGMPIYTPDELGSDEETQDGESGPIPDVPDGGSREAAEAVGKAKIEALKAEAAKKNAPESTATVPPELDAMFSRMTNITAIVAEFAAMKAEIIKIAGSEVPYYEVLAKHGVKKSNELRKFKLARTAAADMYDLLVRMRASNAEPPTEPEKKVVEITDDDVPDVISDAGGAEIKDQNAFKFGGAA